MKFIALFVVLLSFITVTAQQQQDVVHLKNGGVYKGEILSQDSLGLLIKTYGDNILRVEYKDLSYTEKDTLINSPEPDTLPDEGSGVVIALDGEDAEIVSYAEEVTMRKGFTGDIMMGFGVGSTLSAHLKFNMGYNVTPHIYLGCGFGLDGYEGAMMTPALLQRIYIGPAKGVFHPYIWGEEALLAHSTKTFDGNPSIGSEFKVGLGTRFNLAENFALGMQIGFGALSISESYNQPGWLQEPIVVQTTHRVGRLGYSIVLYF